MTSHLPEPPCSSAGLWNPIEGTESMLTLEIGRGASTRLSSGLPDCQAHDMVTIYVKSKKSAGYLIEAADDRVSRQSVRGYPLFLFLERM